MKNQENTEGQQKLVPCDDLEIGKIDLPQIDVMPYVGKRVKISNTGIFKGEFGYMVKVETEIVATIEGRKKPIELRGSAIFGLHEDENGNVGWGNNTKLGVFLAKMKAKNIKELVGKEVVLQTLTTKRGGEFLTFK